MDVVILVGWAALSCVAGYFAGRYLGRKLLVRWNLVGTKVAAVCFVLAIGIGATLILVFHVDIVYIGWTATFTGALMRQALGYRW